MISDVRNDLGDALIPLAVELNENEDVHEEMYEIGDISTTMITGALDYCYKKMWFQYHTKISVQLSQVFKMELGTMFHEAMEQFLSVDKNKQIIEDEYGYDMYPEVAQTTEVEVNDEVKELKGRSDLLKADMSSGELMIYDYKYTTTPSRYIPRLKDMVQVLIYNYVFERELDDFLENGYELMNPTLAYVNPTKKREFVDYFPVESFESATQTYYNKFSGNNQSEYRARYVDLPKTVLLYKNRESGEQYVLERTIDYIVAGIRILDKIIDSYDVSEWDARFREGVFSKEDEFESHNWKCVSEGTMIKTKKGWKPIEEVKKGDKVLTSEGEKEVIKAGENVKDKAIVTVKPYGFMDLDVTSDHKFYVRSCNTTQGYSAGKRQGKEYFDRTYVEAKDLKEKYNRLVYKIPKYSEDEQIKLTEEELIILGAYISEGNGSRYVEYSERTIDTCQICGDAKANHSHIKHKHDVSWEDYKEKYNPHGSNKTGEKQSHRLQFTLHKDETEFADMIVESLKSLFGGTVANKVREDPRNDRKYRQIELTNKEAVKWIEKWVNGRYAHTKEFNPDVMKLPEEQLSYLFDIMVMGDGWIGKNRTNDVIDYTTVSKKLALQVQEIGFRLGQGASIVQQEPKNDSKDDIVSNKIQYHIRIYPNRSYEFVQIEESEKDITITAPINEVIVSDDQKQKLFDLTVKGTPDFLTQGGIVHNCSYCPYSKYCEDKVQDADEISGAKLISTDSESFAEKFDIPYQDYGK